MKYTLVIALTIHSLIGFTQDSRELLILGELVGEVIDADERKEFRLFSHLTSKKFESGQLWQEPDGTMKLVILQSDGTIKTRRVLKSDYRKARIRLGEVPHPGRPYCIGGGAMLVTGPLLIIGTMLLYDGDGTLPGAGPLLLISIGYAMVPTGIIYLVAGVVMNQRYKRLRKEKYANG